MGNRLAHKLEMDLFSLFRRKASTDRKALDAPDPDLLAIFGMTSTSSGISVSRETALQVPAVSAAVRVISEAAASLDISVKRIEADGTETDDPGHPLIGLLRAFANDWTTSYDLLRDLVAEALVSDAGGLAYVNRVGGRPVEIIRYRRGFIAVDYDQATGEPNYRIDNRPVPSANVIHLQSPLGRAPLSMARDAIALAAIMERHAARLFGRGARPGGALMFPKGMGEDAVKKARTAWQAAHEGDDAGGRTAILYDGAEFKPFTLTSTDAQFLELRKFQILEIARAFRVPPSMLFELDRATWSNTEQLGREFLVYCLEPWLLALEGALRKALFLPDERPHFAIRFDRDDLTRADLTTRATAINSLIASRVLNPNEGRSWLGLMPYAAGDAFANPNITTDTPAEAADGSA